MEQDEIGLLVIIRSIAYMFEEHQKISYSLSKIQRNPYELDQGKYMNLEWYHELFQAQVEGMEDLEMTIEDKAVVKAMAQNQFLQAMIESRHASNVWLHNLFRELMPITRAI